MYKYNIIYDSTHIEEELQSKIGNDKIVSITRVRDNKILVVTEEISDSLRIFQEIQKEDEHSDI